MTILTLELLRARSPKPVLALALLLAAGIGLLGCAETEEEKRAKRGHCRQLVTKALSEAQSNAGCQALLRRVAGLQRKKANLTRIYDGYRSGRRRVGPSSFLSRAMGADRAGSFAAARSAKRDLDRLALQERQAMVAFERTQLAVARKSLKGEDRALVSAYLPEFFDEEKTPREIERLVESEA